MLLIGIVSPETARHIARGGARIDGAALELVREGDLVAVMARPPRNPLRLLTRRGGLKELVRLQRILEALLPHGSLLAARPGTRAEPAVIRKLLISDRERLLEALRTFGSDVQYQIIVHWDGAATLAAEAGDDALRDAIARAGQGREDGKTAMLARIRSLRDGLQARLRDLIEPVAAEIQTLPLDGEDMVANLTVRIGRGGEPAIEAALQSLDQLLPGNSRIRLIGPLPALSFAALSLEHVDAAAVAEARKLLGVKPTASLAELRANYYRLAQDHHPDVSLRSDGSDVVDAAAKAYKLLKRVADSSGGVDATTVLDIVRHEDGIRRAA